MLHLKQPLPVTPTLDGKSVRDQWDALRSTATTDRERAEIDAIFGRQL